MSVNQRVSRKLPSKTIARVPIKNSRRIGYSATRFDPSTSSSHITENPQPANRFGRDFFADFLVTRARAPIMASRRRRARVSGDHRSRNVRAICSSSGLRRYCSMVRSWVWMKASAGIPGTRRMSLRRATSAAGSETRTV
jgi:hypothetical protein